MSVEVVTPASREDWLGLRGRTIGASEAACLFGAHPFQSLFTLWASKSGLLSEDPSETGAMRRGRLLESVAVEFLREERPDWQVTANPIPGGRFYRDLALGVSCTPDAFVVDPTRAGFAICQIKSVEPSVYRKRWHNEAGEVEVPAYVAIQAIQEAKLTGASWAIVCPLVVGFDIQMPILEVPLHAGIWDRLVEETAAFWARVASGEPPAADYARDGDTIADLWPPDETREALDLSLDNRAPALVDEMDDLKAQVKAAEARLSEIKAEITEKLAGAGLARLADGREITRTLQRRAEYIAKASVFAVLRIRTPKKKAA